MMMKIKAIVEKRVFGIMELEIPDDFLENGSVLANKRRINKQVENGIENNANVIWDDDSTIHYAGNYVVANPTFEKLINENIYIHTGEDLIKNKISEFVVNNGGWYGKVENINNRSFLIHACENNKNEREINVRSFTKDSLLDLYIEVTKIDEKLYSDARVENIDYDILERE